MFSREQEAGEGGKDEDKHTGREAPHTRIIPHTLTVKEVGVLALEQCPQGQLLGCRLKPGLWRSYSVHNP